MPIVIIALILFVLFGGLGFIAHILWLGIVLAAIVFLFGALTGNNSKR